MLANELNKITKEILKDNENKHYERIIKLAREAAYEGSFYIIVEEYISEKNKNRLLSDKFRLYIKDFSTEINWRNK